MAKFDILNAASGAYVTSWQARRYLLRLAAVPLALKLFCFTLAQIYAGSNDTDSGSYLLFMLIMVPALVAEGWMLAHYVRFLVFGQTWPFKPTGNPDHDGPALADRARGILAGMIVFVLTNMAIGFLNELVSTTMMPYIPADIAAQAAPIPPHIAFLSVAIIFFMFWGFRMLWLYIPFSLNMDWRLYLTGLKGAKGSLNLIGVWLLCFVPFIVLLKIAVMLVATPISLTLGTGMGMFASTILSVVADTFKSIVTTAGITLGLREVFTPKKPAGR